MSAPVTQTRLWLVQRLSGAFLAAAVAVHLVTMIYAMKEGLSAAEILSRTQGNLGWFVFYSMFVTAAALHAPIGLRTVLTEVLPKSWRGIDGAVSVFGLILLVTGLRAVFGLYAPGGL
ncbi:MAG: succinate dehydrogenase [Rhodospirillales bacterium]|nr:succinate dehydrogenase [Rhodospirillales bacterium]